MQTRSQDWQINIDQMPARAFVPCGCHRAWLRQKPTGKVFALGVGAPLSEMRHRLDFSGGELAGAIGPAWFSLEHTGKDCVPFTPCFFPWHSHAAGPAVFSLDDLAIFLLAAAPVMALITPVAMAVAQKNEQAWRLGAILRKNDAPCGPNLRMQRLFNCLSARIGDVRAMPAEALPGLIGISVHTGGYA